MSRALKCFLIVGLVTGLTALVIPLQAPVQAKDDPFAKERIGEDADFNFDEMANVLSLRFYDAVTGKPIEGARVALGEETSVTDAGGKASFKFPRIKREEGYVHALFDKKGYVPSKVAIHIILGSVFIHRYSISPTLPPGRYRVVVDWHTSPPDLDAHLVKHGRYHISFRDMKKFEDLAWLDRDDVDGEGPETITIKKLDPAARYTFLVHDYTNRSKSKFSEFKKSKAHVKIFNDRELVKSFEVPSGAGRVWKVFEIVNSQIVPGSQIVDSLK